MNMTITISDKIAHHLNSLSLGEVIDVLENGGTMYSSWRQF